jgi:hypothetical protein
MPPLLYQLRWQKNQAHRHDNTTYLLLYSQNPHTEHIIFDVVDMPYPYDAIVSQRLLNTFKAALHPTYLCLKIRATSGIITIFGSQMGARNIEQGLTPVHKNLHFLGEGIEYKQPPSEQETSAEFKKAIQPEGDFTRVALDLRVPDITICIGADMTLEDKVELI